EIDRVQDLLQSTAQLEFWHVYQSNQFQNFFVQANETLKGLEEQKTETAQTTVDTTDAETDEIDALLQSADDSVEVAQQNNPLFDLMVSPGFQGGPVLATFNIKDTAKVSQYLNMPQVRN
ncbi:protein translocase subunit SecDF, partial [Tamlana crocina]|nr:protein translocase subunit SecDF [Tamlana crocina]